MGRLLASQHELTNEIATDLKDAHARLEDWEALRDHQAVVKLPAEESAACQKLWPDVETARGWARPR
jgi:hypothetical protein